MINSFGLLYGLLQLYDWQSKASCKNRNEKLQMKEKSGHVVEEVLKIIYNYTMKLIIKLLNYSLDGLSVH